MVTPPLCIVPASSDTWEQTVDSETTVASMAALMVVRVLIQPIRLSVSVRKDSLEKTVNYMTIVPAPPVTTWESVQISTMDSNVTALRDIRESRAMSEIFAKIRNVTDTENVSTAKAVSIASVKTASLAKNASRRISVSTLRVLFLRNVLIRKVDTLVSVQVG